MRRKRRRSQSWLASLFSPKARASGKSDDVEPQETEPLARESAVPPPPSQAPGEAPRKKGRDLASVLASLPAEARAKKLVQKEPPALEKPEETAGPGKSSSPAEKAAAPKKGPRPVIKLNPPATNPDGTPVAPPPKEEWWMIYWRKVGGGSLVLSLVIHLVLLGIASFIVTSVVSPKAVDFLSGGGSKSGEQASAELAQQVKRKKLTSLYKPTPLRKVVSTSISASIALPDMPPDALPLPDMTSVLGGTMGSGGFGSSGAGGGFGNGMGLGGMAGRSFKPIVMFGRNLNARSIAVILDVSGSMTPHLSTVVEELDRVAKGSPVILYVGCGVAKPVSGMHLEDDAMDTRRSAFRAFWREDHGPEQEVYSIMSRRPYTYYIKSQGIGYAWIALLNDQVRNAEALYWFSDFQDGVEDDMMASVLTNLKRRKQKLFIHASDEGSYFETIRDKLCLPSGGAVIKGKN